LCPGLSYNVNEASYFGWGPICVKVTVSQFEEQLAELLDRAATSGEECIIQQEGKEDLVFVSAREWERRTGSPIVPEKPRPMDASAARLEEIGRRLDALGPEYRLSAEKQERVEELLARKEERTTTECRELEALLQESDSIMLRRAKALEQVV
jgi:prevent-host-death family protein